MKNQYHVLHIDDDLFIRAIIQHSLGVDFEITSCIDGLEAMSWLEKGNRPDIILTDLSMPLLGGQEFISLIRSSSLYHNVPIVVLSSAEDSVLKARCIDQGADDFIVKPFNPVEMKSRINALLRRTNDRQSFRPSFDSTSLRPLR